MCHRSILSWYYNNDCNLKLYCLAENISDTVIMVLGGNPDLKTDIELIDVSPEGGVCTKPADFPGEVDLSKGAIGAFVEGMPMVCGGIEGQKECHGYHLESQSWSKLPFQLLKARQEAAGVTLTNGSWLIIGGKESKEALSDSEILINRQFHHGTLWPMPFWGHCAIEINQTHAFIAGGMNQKEYIRSSYVYAFSNGYWTWITNLNYDRSGHICGVVENLDNANMEILTAGGKGILEVELFSLLTGTWRDGPKLPHEMDKAASVKIGKSILLVGGLHLGTCPIKLTECFSSRYIYELGDSTWEVRNYSMEVQRGQHIALLIPKKNLDNACSKQCPSCSGICKIFKENN